MTTHRLLRLIGSATCPPSHELRYIIALLSAEFSDTPRAELEAAVTAAQASAAGSCSRQEMLAAARALLGQRTQQAA